MTAKKETVKKTAAKAAEPVAKAEKEVKAVAKKAAPKAAAPKAAAAKKAEVTSEDPPGGIITPEEILKKVGKADRVYVRVDQNKAYWVRGEETGSVDLW